MSDADREGPLYFGCWNSVGHGFHTPTGKNCNNTVHPNQEGVAVGRIRILGPPTPWGNGVERLAPGGRSPDGQGDAALHHKDGWTALAVDDFTIDSRGNSKSVFCFPTTVDFDDALALASEHFPRIVKRVGTIRPVTP